MRDDLADFTDEDLSELRSNVRNALRTLKREIGPIDPPAAMLIHIDTLERKLRLYDAEIKRREQAKQQHAHRLKFFLSYRRSDPIATGSVGRVFDRLKAHYGVNGIFLDVYTIPPGTDFRSHIAQQLAGSTALLALIGPETARSLKDREAQEEDFVRVEWELALQQPILIVPILLGETKVLSANDLPPSVAAVARLNAIRIELDRGFDDSVARLIQELDRRFTDSSGRTADEHS
jgi:hypothetical protein